MPDPGLSEAGRSGRTTCRCAWQAPQDSTKAANPKMFEQISSVASTEFLSRLLSSVFFCLVLPIPIT